LCFWTLSIVLFIFQNTFRRRFCLRLQVKPTLLGPFNRASPYLRTKQDGVLDKDKTMDNVQKHNIFTNILSSRTFRSFLASVMVLMASVTAF
jgi:hypothetical protein